MGTIDDDALGGLLVIAIDGPVASGKSELGRRLAERLGWRMLDTGVMYRALTWLALERSVDLQDETALTRLAEAVQMEVGPPLSGSDESATIIVDGLDATAHLREKHVESSVSTVAAVAGARQQLVARQREEAEREHLVIVGRDIGTVVAPDAAVKIYLVATPTERARRRAAEIRATGRSVAERQVLEDLLRRDERDAGRIDSPLRAAENAQEMDTSALSIDKMVEAALQIVAKRLPEAMG